MNQSNKQPIRFLKLPDEILFKIIKLAGCDKERSNNIRLVCKRLYAVYCEFTSCGLTFDCVKTGADIFESMINSSRRPFRIEIVNLEIGLENSQLQKIIHHFAVHTKTLDFSKDYGQNCSKKIKMADFESIVRSVINLEEVKFEGINVSGDYSELANNPIQLPKLKKLTVEQCEEDAMNLLLCISASNLLEFHIHIFEDVSFDFTQFFKGHKTIKNITMSGLLQYPNAFKQLELTHLRIYNDGDVSFLRDVIAHQSNLQHLNLLFHFDLPYGMDEDDDLPKPIVNDELFTVICSLTKLESLKIGIGELSPNLVDWLANLVNLKELVINPMPSNDDEDDDNDYDRDQNEKRRHVNTQILFRKVVAVKLPNLNSFTWSYKDDGIDVLDMDDSFYNYEDRLIEAAHQRDLAALGNFDIIKTMAKSFPNLKYLEIKMPESVDPVNIHDILELLPLLEVLKLQVSSTFKTGAIRSHEKMKQMKVDEISVDSLIPMMQLMPNLESLKIKNTRFPLQKSFVQELNTTIPNGLKRLELKLHSQNSTDFAMGNIQILQHITKRLQKCEIKLTGSGSFDSISEKIDRSIDPNMGVSMPRSPKGYYPGDDYENHESYMKLWK